MKIPKTLFVSFPRTGHHYLASLIRGYYGDELKYCDPYTNPERVKIANLTKCHDFKLDAKPYPSTIALTRGPLPSLMSYFEFGVNSGWFHDTNEKWEWFAKSKYLFYRQWMCKWQAIAYLNGFPFINYGKLIRSPAHTLMDVLHYFGEDPKWDDVMNAVSQPVAAPTLGYYHRNKSTREIKEFKHYDRRFLQRIGLLTAK